MFRGVWFPIYLYLCNVCVCCLNALFFLVRVRGVYSAMDVGSFTWRICCIPIDFSVILSVCFAMHYGSFNLRMCLVLAF